MAIEDKEKYDFLRSIQTDHHWTGGYDGDGEQEGVWKWINNADSLVPPPFNLFEFASWRPDDNSPSNTLYENDRGRGEDYLLLNNDGKFQDFRHNQYYQHYFCQGNRGKQNSCIRAFYLISSGFSTKPRPVLYTLR